MGAMVLGVAGAAIGAFAGSGDGKLRCHNEKENYCEKYEQKQVANPFYKGE